MIGRCLAGLTQGAGSDDLEIIVVANGCTDATVQLASGFAGVTVLETEQASKHAAITLGDARASGFPRAFVDADIEVTAEALLHTAQEMDAAGALIAAPALAVDLRQCPPAVRAYYRVWRALDWSTVAPVGSGVYILSAAGRERLGEFPKITNDDQYVHDTFAPHERLCVPAREFTVRPARTMATLVGRRTRTMSGQAELRAHFGDLPGRASGPGMLALARREPRRVLDIACYSLITVLAKHGAWRKRKRASIAWERDDSSRMASSRA